MSVLPPKPNSRKNSRKYTASLAASEAAMISASHEDRAREVCFLLTQLIEVLAYWKVMPVVECFTAQSGSEKP